MSKEYKDFWKAIWALERSRQDLYLAWLDLWSPAWWVAFKKEENKEIEERMSKGGPPPPKEVYRPFE